MRRSFSHRVFLTLCVAKLILAGFGVYWAAMTTKGVRHALFGASWREIILPLPAALVPLVAALFQRSRSVEMEPST